ncbi:hypothetical protein B0J17DRAFT_718684 [Rhizoctonia solani]|nr:hypothetical protein B0J17DRAFT_718684 [Rhizoctonia solani]
MGGGGRCKDLKCADKAVEVDGLEVCGKLRDINIFFPDEEDEKKLDELVTMECHATSHVRQLRVYSCVLMASIGIPLWRAESLRQFLPAFDRILGVFNIGVLHRDISDGNAMMLSDTQEFNRREWRERRKKGSGPQAKILFESEKVLCGVLAELGHHDPAGMLSDFDLHAQRSSPSNRIDSAEPMFTSGPAIYSARARDEDTVTKESGAKGRAEAKRDRLLNKEGSSVHSFFWLILWSAAAHLDDDQDRPTLTVQEVLDHMNQNSLKLMWGWKMGQLLPFTRDPDGLIETLDSFGNERTSRDMFRHVIPKLAVFFDDITLKTRPGLESSPGTRFLLLSGSLIM